jgi:uncharacterized protein (DUF58 family)
MITSRGWWFLIVSLAVMVAGALGARWMLAYLGLSLLLWFVFEGFLFSFRIRKLGTHATLARQLLDGRGQVESLWSGRTFDVCVQINLPPGNLPYLRLIDRVPFNLVRTSGKRDVEGRLSADTPIEMRYTIRCPSAGQVRFEGIALHAADLQGFFYHYAFLQQPAVYRILPPLVDAEGNRPMLKRTNLLPSPGQHRQLRPGSGSELLDLRDYLPGDPPKTIAWKVSARRDRLITKEFESEVPVRCTLFVDVSQSVRVGFAGGNALGRLVEISAAIAQATAAQRDLVGVCLIDDEVVRRVIRPSRGTRHVTDILHVLAEAASSAPATGTGSVDQLLPLAHALAEDVYPHLLHQDFNRVPSWLPWLWPSPVKRMKLWPPVPLFRRLLWYCLGTLPILAVAIPVAILWDAIEPFLRILLVVEPEMLLPVQVGFLFALLIFYFLAWGVFGRVARHFFSFRRRRLFRWRKRVAAILSDRDAHGSGGLSRLLEDDQALQSRLQEFLAEHHVPYPLPLYDAEGRYVFASPGKVQVLADALLRTVGRGRDNELYVLLVDLVELDGWLDPLLRAVKVARARHHQVMLVCPWPPGATPPKKIAETLVVDPNSPDETLEALTHRRWLRGYLRVRRTFTRLGVPVLAAADKDVPRLILERLDRLRSMGMGSRQ